MVNGSSARWTSWALGLALLVLVGGCGSGGESGGVEVASIDGFVDLDGDPLSAGDADGDGLLDSLESAPRTIVIDSSGFGLGTNEVALLERREVTSDPSQIDTDGDGLTDYEEYIIRTDPRSEDTDGDGLSDYDEWNKWWSSPVTVDSDGDATGPDHDLPPNQLLFDGTELAGTRKGSTSPTLDDTDGDGKTDYEEIDHPTRSPLIADLPRAKVELIGAPRIQLFVEYAEEEAEEQSFSSVLTASAAESTSSTNASTSEVHTKIGVELHYTHGFKTGFDGGATNEVGIKGSFENEWVSTNSQSYTTESVRETQEEAGRYWGTSSSYTETASSGEIFLDMRIRNLSDSMAFRVSQLGVAVRMWSPGRTPEEGSYQTLAVLVPTGFENFTLAPGGATGVFPVSATGLNPKLVKEFLTFPERLIFETIYFDLENADGLNFNFLTENAYVQTASISIDNGVDEPEVVRVATNVNRSDPDENGEGGARYVGVRLKRVLEEILGKRVQTTTRDVEFKGITRRVSVLEKFEDAGAIEDLLPPLLYGTAEVTQGSRIITVTAGVDTSADEWWSEILGRTLLPLGAKGEVLGQAYVIVQAEASDLGVGELRLDRPFEEDSGSIDFEVNDLFQSDPHLLPEDPTQPAPVLPGGKQSFWFLIGSESMVEAGRLTPHTDFEDVVLKGGDQIQLSFWSDEDGDGLSTVLESGYGTTEVATEDCASPVDCDGDGLGDSVEALRGWMAGAPGVLPAERALFLEVLDAVRAGNAVPAPGTPPHEAAYLESLKAKIKLNDPARDYPKWVHSHPRTINPDEDALTDFFECVHGTDPNNPDTDGDGLLDGLDPEPLVPAQVLHVNKAWTAPLDAEGTPLVIAIDDPARGLSWETAFVHLQDALAAARLRNADTTVDGALILANDIGQIWVASGNYSADEGDDGALQTFELIDRVAVIGGFDGDEKNTAQRGDGVTTLLSASGGSSDTPIVSAAAGLTRAAVLDSFSIVDAQPLAHPAGPGLLNAGSPTIRNIVFQGHRVDDYVEGGEDYVNPAGAAVVDRGTTGIAAEALYQDCVFSSNHHFRFGGAMYFEASSSQVVGCRFENNSAARWGGAVYCRDCEGPRFEQCVFANNAGTAGGAACLQRADVLFQDCTFFGNSTNPTEDPRFRFKHHNWVIGVTAQAVGDVDDVLYPDGDLSTPYPEERDGDSDTGYVDNEDKIKAGDTVTFKPGPIAEIGSKEGLGSPVWEPPESYADKFERDIRGEPGHRHRAGGAIYCFDTSHLVLVQCVLHRNQASVGGAVACNDGTQLDLLGCTFAKNEAIGLGGAVFAPDAATSGRIINCLAAGEAASVVGPPPPPELNIVLESSDRSTPGGDPGLLYHLFYYDDSELVGKEGFYPGGDLKKDLDPVKYHTDGWVNLRDFEYRDPVIPTRFYIASESVSLENNLLLTAPVLQGEVSLGFSGYLGNIVGGNASGGGIALEDVRFLDRLRPTDACEAVDRGKVSGIDYDPFTPGVQPAPKLDISGSKRSQGGGIDIGAYEFGSDAR